MRKKQTFLLTIITPETETSSFCGRLKVISSGKTSTFTNLDELYELIASEMDTEMLQFLTRTAPHAVPVESPDSPVGPIQSLT